MKRTAAMLLLLLMLASTMAFYLFYAGRLVTLHREARHRMSGEELEVLRLDLDAYRRARIDDHEILIDGRMYDVARVISAGDSVVLHAVHDSAEDELIAMLHMVFDTTPESGEAVPEEVLRLLSMVFLLPAAFTSSPATIAGQHDSTYKFSIVTFHHELATPPPWPC